MDNFIIGKYINKNTFLHKIDPRVKIFLLISLMVGIFLNYGTFLTTFIVDGLILIFILIMLFISGTKFKYILNSLKFIWITLIFIFLINILVPHDNYSYVLVRNGGFVIYLESIFQSIRIMLRITMLILLTLLFTSSTKSLDIAYGFKFYLYPLKLLHFPIDDLSMIMSLALRFIPVILEETHYIKKAQEARGVLFNKGNIFKRLKAYISILVPLLVASFSRSMELADAMDARHYQPGKKRTSYHEHKLHMVDFYAGFAVILLCCGLFTIAYYQPDLLKGIFNIANEITILR